MKASLAQSEDRMFGSTKDLSHNLLGWYDHARRVLPWRGEKDPYRIWISETMLQQTQVETVKSYYHKFLAKFPTIESLAAADLQEVLAVWAGLGYYRRAKHLHQAAQILAAAETHPRLPDTVETLRQLPGIGRYTAGAVASIAFNRPAAAVDGNVVRVLARLTGFDRDVGVAANVEFFWKLAQEIHARHARRNAKYRLRNNAVRTGPRHGDLTQALMELGAVICTPVPSAPRCGECPLRRPCVAAAEGRQGELPVKMKKAKVPVVRGVAVVMVRSQKLEARSQNIEVLLGQRGNGGLWEGMWEFPVMMRSHKSQVSGSKSGASRRNHGEEEIAMARALAGESGLRVDSVKLAGRVTHQLTHRRFELEVVRVALSALSAAAPARRGDNVKVRGLGSAYVAFRWVPWPMKGAAKLPIARVVEKVAEAAELGP
jgi:A/G-specific adenine glycosylase